MKFSRNADHFDLVAVYTYDKSKKMSSIKCSDNVYKEDDGPGYHVVSACKASAVTMCLPCYASQRKILQCNCQDACCLISSFMATVNIRDYVGMVSCPNHSFPGQA